MAGFLDRHLPATELLTPLITCPDCGHAVSRTAESCPGCGWRLKPKASTAETAFTATFYVVAALVVIGLIFGVLNYAMHN